MSVQGYQPHKMEGEEFRTGSADSENGSDNSYVHVQATQEDAQHAPAAPRIPAVDDEEDIYGAEERTPTQGDQVKHQPAVTCWKYSYISVLYITCVYIYLHRQNIH